MRLVLRYDMRQPDPGVDLGRYYAAAVEQCAWADRLGFEEVQIGEHHGAEDGYIPSSIVLGAAIAARTARLRVHLDALVVTMHHALRLAEDLAVLDILSNGRLMVTAGMGYRPHEFEMMGVEFQSRLKIYLETIAALRRAWTGAPFEFRGRTVRVTPRPVSPQGPWLAMGGSIEKAAVRAARMGLPFVPGHPAIYDAYRRELAALGAPEPPPLHERPANFIFVTVDPERDWTIVGPHLVYGTNSYARWAAERAGGTTRYQPLAGIEDARRSPLFRIVTPQQCLAFARALGPHGELYFQPLFGGLDPDHAWRSLELFERAVYPTLCAENLVDAPRPLHA